ncbi:hypothetical protein PVAND_004912 [Polypedilum vanderplanki]|uniref:Uncharacterized protein n=1 Tax=Polypedilum vanderplanki TaxID=319348 RepID=A0A9J6BZ61_POLVA|nr:hypothetical protein PVAND_004912 [Polypedilum vanderplanki]
MDIVKFKKVLDLFSTHFVKIDTDMDNIFKLDEQKFEEYKELARNLVSTKKKMKQSKKIEMFCQMTPILTKSSTERKGKRKIFDDIRNISKDESNHSLLKFNKMPKFNVNSNESDIEEKNVPKWCNHYKKAALYQTYTNIDLCATLFLAKPDNHIF